MEKLELVVLQSKKISNLIFRFLTSKENEVVFNSMLARELKVSPSTINSQIRPLEKLGIIKRTTREKFQAYEIDKDEFLKFISRICEADIDEAKIWKELFNNSWWKKFSLYFVLSELNPSNVWASDTLGQVIYGLKQTPVDVYTSESAKQKKVPKEVLELLKEILKHRHLETNNLTRIDYLINRVNH